MVEASPTKVYFAKYFFLAFCILQWIVAGIILFRFEDTPKNHFAALVLFALGLVFFSLFLFVGEKIKRVAVGKNKLVVIEGTRNVRVEWPEVKSLRIIPFFNMYKMRVKGKKKSIYFFPSKNIDPAFGLLAKDTSKMGEIVEKRKKEYRIK